MKKDVLVVLAGEEHADGAILQLHDGFAIIPLVEELQQVSGVLAGLGDGQLAGVGGTAGAHGHVVGAMLAALLKGQDTVQFNTDLTGFEKDEIAALCSKLYDKDVKEDGFDPYTFMLTYNATQRVREVYDYVWTDDQV